MWQLHQSRNGCVFYLSKQRERVLELVALWVCVQKGYMETCLYDFKRMQVTDSNGL